MHLHTVGFAWRVTSWRSVRACFSPRAGWTASVWVQSMRSPLKPVVIMRAARSAARVVYSFLNTQNEYTRTHAQWDAHACACKAEGGEQCKHCWVQFPRVHVARRWTVCWRVAGRKDARQGKIRRGRRQQVGVRLPCACVDRDSLQMLLTLWRQGRLRVTEVSHERPHEFYAHHLQL